MNRILIVRMSALGDIVHALPVLAALRRAWPAARVDWIVDEAYAPILSLAEGLHKRVVVRAETSYQTGDAISFGGATGYLGAVRHLRAQRYDVALDLQGLLKSAVWARLSGAARVIGFDRAHLREPLAAAFYSETVVPLEAPHVIQKNLSILTALNLPPGAVELPLHPVAGAAAIAAITAAGGSGHYMVLNPGAAWPNKRWPAERFGALAAQLRARTGRPSLVTWGPGERALAEQVAGASDGAAAPAPPTAIADLAVIVRDAALVVSGDTGPLHIAAAMGTPLVGLYGPTWPERNGPWNPDDQVISRAGGCVCHHKRQCQRGAPCINEIAVSEVLAAVERRLSHPRQGFHRRQGFGGRDGGQAPQ
ncbi:MAG: lipopolysaccharide heptosyltransferase I [Acidobacteria bacterium]|nr:lipopolysaccharide heptosyltransferase I [Acidobacteriota bacterium]MSO62859.1 lipopolysaccharide heptosyltransferase I [Acidobacteriota bacterium]